MPMLPRWVAAVAAGLTISVLIAAEFAYRAPRPLAADAAPTLFSAARAQRSLARVLDDQAPHPLGSAANAEVRARILAELTDLGLQPQVQTALSTHRGAVARVHNILARIDGERPGAVLLAAHHDSVGAGPGASDDGAGVAAILETARALRHGPALAHPVILLIDDGEEFGLFGARAFCSHPWAKEVAVVLNFEARGTTGASLLFETAGGDLWTMRQAARSLARPMTGSAFAAVYHTLPNGTDLSVFDQQGMRGLNFAFIGGARRYHTPLDDLAHLDLSSLQHHGDNMLALARTLAQAPDLQAARSEHAVWFDLLGQAVVVLPRAYELPVCGGLIVAWVLLCIVRRRVVALRARPLAAGLAIVPAALTLAAGVGFLLSQALQALGRLPTPFPPNPIAHQTCYGFGGMAAALAVLAFVRARLDGWYAAGGIGGFLALLATAGAFVVPGSSYPILVVAAMAWLGAVLPARARVAAAAVACLSALVNAVVLAPFFTLLPATLGARAGLVHAAVAALGTLSLAWVWPALLGRRMVDAVVVTALAAVGSVGLAMWLPAHDADHPARANLVHVNVAGRKPIWFLDDFDGLVLPRQRVRPLPWERTGWCGAAEPLGVEPPQVDFERQARGRDKMVLRGSMRSTRAAPWLGLYLPPGLQVERAVLAGVKVSLTAPGDRRSGRGDAEGWVALTFLGAEPDEEIPFEVTCRGRSPQKPYVFDRTPGLPPSARIQALITARERALAAPIHLGDGIVTAAPLTDW